MEFTDSFTRRHIGPNPTDIKNMLNALGFQSLDEMISKAVPKNILSQKAPEFYESSEFETVQHLKQILSKNKVNHSFIGMGYYDTITPSVILRNVFENPAWYTAYTPYQAEISQGRMEALLNFQTMITDLTGMEISNSSLLDEGTAAAEAVFMAHNLTKKKDATVVLVSQQCHPHVIEVIQTRAEPLGLTLKVETIGAKTSYDSVFGVVLQYPGTDGSIENYKSIADQAHQNGVYVIASTDLLALTLITPPGQWGADIVVGNTQRFGVPMGFGGPHAAFLATRDANKRLMPGRLIGVSKDADNNPALRLALQTREQHIRREKATSNICTAQVLLANMASFYAVYHGPQGLKNIALKIHTYAQILKQGLKSLGYAISDTPFFDTISLRVSASKAETILPLAAKHELNFRHEMDNAKNEVVFGLSINETTQKTHILNTLRSFNGDKEVLTAGQWADFELKFKTSLAIPQEFKRTTEFLTHSVFNSYHSETELLRYIYRLQTKDLSLTHSMIPLGSCTMKLNATTELLPVSWPEVNAIHPFAPKDQTTGYLEMIKDLEKKLCMVTGFDGVSLQPNAGSQGEYAGLLVIRKYFASRGESHRNVVLIPSSAHGTNPASAMLAGMQVVVVNCDALGNVDLTDLKSKAAEHKSQLAALMITYPSTHGVFEEAIVEICKVVHENGGQVYMDGANLNALVGLCYPGSFGPDVSHMNLHKTFAIPHGGGGPGVGPIGVKSHLVPFLPKHSLCKDAGPASGISAVTSAPWGSASILPISWSYIHMMGGEGLRKATQVAILSANYLAKKLSPHYPVLYKGKEGLVAHECIIDLREIKKQSGIDVADVAKRLMDYGFHAPTMSFPVAGTLMIEPTESESKAELDRFIEAMISIREEIQKVEKGTWTLEDNPLVHAPHTQSRLLKSEWNHKYSREEAAYPLKWLRSNKFWPAVSRVDNAYGDRHLICTCPPLSEYE